MSAPSLTVLADLRWPSHTGIGLVQEAYIAHKPADIELIDLGVPGKIGHPLSPLRVALSIRSVNKAGAVFWNAGFIPPLFGLERAIVFVHDLTHVRHYDRLRRVYYSLVLRRLYRRCAAVVCVSEYTRSEFLEWSGTDPAKVHALRNGTSPEFIENREALCPGYKYVLYPGNHRPYKNIVRLIHAYARSGLERRGIHLLLTGQPEKAETAAIDELGIAGYVHYCGRVPQAEMPKYYRGAEAIAFVSLYEGFGLPILEAMASDTAVVTSSVSAMPEVAGDAALIVDPYSVDDIANALVTATCDMKVRQELIEKGRRRVQSFSWEPSAKAFWQLVRSVGTTSLDA